MKIRIVTPYHRLTKKQLVLLENLAFTRNWKTGHGSLESLDDIDSGIKILEDSLIGSKLVWEVIK